MIPIKHTNEYQSLIDILHVHNENSQRMTHPYGLDELSQHSIDVIKSQEYYYCPMPSGLDRSENEELDKVCDYVGFLEDKIESLERLLYLYNPNHPK